MSTQGILTWYSATSSGAEDEQLHFERVGTEPLGSWYKRFIHLRTVRQNEELLGALVTAADKGVSMVIGDGCVHMFVKGAFPAAYMGMQKLSHCSDITIPGEDVDGMQELLGRQRIAYSPHRLHGFFVNAEGETLDPGEVHIPFQASTLEAVREMAEGEFEDCEDFFGEDIIGFSRAAPQA